ncbi:hypothetical protein EZ449_09185 [Pedobacter frigidisoli]|uniref:Uncharacterized protein n=1 Tax=Pedobacter frigidisoli TaxID=2530455 RepID=A0A4R0P205_9SPHI|nr:hypothetical protein [Pedobacter frigidisoli]TCD10510.1 hypothetical protein EZ449_09185 [Pedobacter frigidisoli]
MKAPKIILVVTVCLLFCFIFFVQSDTKVMMATAIAGNKTFPPACYIKVDGNEYLIENIYKYDNKILSEFWFVGSEGFAVQKLGLLANEYSAEQKPYQFLSYSKNKADVVFNSKKYKIDYQMGDTIISKIDSDKIILFIDK